MTDKKQKRKPRSYTDEFKQQLVLLYQNGKRKCDICREYDIAASQTKPPAGDGEIEADIKLWGMNAIILNTEKVFPPKNSILRMDLTHLTNLLFSQNDNLEASVEPSGIQIYGEMPEEIWETWYTELKKKLSVALGYERGCRQHRY